MQTIASYQVPAGATVRTRLFGFSLNNLDMKNMILHVHTLCNSNDRSQVSKQLYGHQNFACGLGRA